MTQPIDHRYCRYTDDRKDLCDSPAIGDTSEISMCIRHTMMVYRLMTSNDLFMEFRDFKVSPEQRARINARNELRNQERLEKAARDGVIYYLRFGDRIKIGTTTHLNARLSSVPHDELLATEPGDHRLETLRHRQFKHCRVHREWFDGTDESLLRHVAMLRDTPETLGA